MPLAPLKPCRRPGCPRLVEQGYCPLHQPVEAPRAGSSGRGYTAAWQRASKAFLRDNPLCRRCQQDGRLTPATVVDHIVPHAGNSEMFWTRDNWQPLCKHCHDRKTVQEDGGFGRKRRPE